MINDNFQISIAGNGGKLHQASLNIISTVQQAIPESGIINSSTKTENDFAIITISDTGLRIKKEHLSQIFNPFYTTKDTGNGNGLRLVKTYKILHEHYGKLNTLQISERLL